MEENVSRCVAARVDFFSQYYTVPEAAAGQVAAFCEKVTSLGRQSADAQAFEAAFASQGLQEEFTRLLMLCTPKAQTMTREQKAHSRQVAKEMHKGQIGKAIVEDLLDTAQMEAESQLITKKREAMIQSGTLDEYTRASNVLEDVGRLGKFFQNRFGKKK